MKGLYQSHSTKNDKHQPVACIAFAAQDGKTGTVDCVERLPAGYDWSKGVVPWVSTYYSMKTPF